MVDSSNTVNVTAARFARASIVERAVKQSFIKLSVYYENKAVQRSVETPKYTLDTTMSSLGGAISLFLGISIIACFEMFELIIRIVRKIVSSI